MAKDLDGYCLKKRAIWMTISLIIILVSSGCASAPVPNEATIEALRISHDQLMGLVASGQISPEQARDQYYAKLADVDPKLPDIDSLVNYRRQLSRQVVSAELTADQANAKLTTRESEMLARWEQMAAEYAAEQRRLEQTQYNYERGHQEQIRIEQGSGIRNLPPNSPK